MLASEAQVDVALVARLFGSKSMLWLAVIDDLPERQVSHLKKTKALAELSVHSPDQAFKECVELFAQMSFEIPEFLRSCSRKRHPGESVWNYFQLSWSSRSELQVRQS